MTAGSSLRLYEDFCRELSVALLIPETRLRSCDRLVADLGLDEMGMAELVLTLSHWNPHFHVPDQMDIEDVRLGDLHQFVCGMTEGHVGP